MRSKPKKSETNWRHPPGASEELLRSSLGLEQQGGCGRGPRGRQQDTCPRYVCVCVCVQPTRALPPSRSLPKCSFTSSAAQTALAAAAMSASGSLKGEQEKEQRLRRAALGSHAPTAPPTSLLTRPLGCLCSVIKSYITQRGFAGF